MPNSTSSIVGVVEELWRYPVKSMLGEQLTTTEVTERGLLGDLAYALRDVSDGKSATAKNPRKWPNLFAYSAVLTGTHRILTADSHRNRELCKRKFRARF